MTLKFWARSFLVLTLFGAATSVFATEITSPAKQAHVTDFATGKVLFSKDADAPMKPASMAKIMTIFVAFQRIADGQLGMDDKFIVSEKAWKKGGSRTFLEVGKTVSVRELLYGIIVQSGNDAAIVLAEGISGTENAFADEMNFWAKKIGMKNTNFQNSTGWPDPDQTTTAADLNIMTSELIRRFPANKYPNLYPIFAEREYTYNKISQPNRNPLIYGSAGADGLKTGYTKESGYGLVGSAERDGQRVIMVLNGMTSMKQRSAEARRLMDLMFREFKIYRFFDKGQPVDQANVWLGNATKIDLVLDEPLHLLLSYQERRDLKLSVQWLDPVPAPILAGDQLGTLTVDINGDSRKLVLRAGHDIPVLGMFDRVSAAVKYLIFGASVTPSIAK
ncbi:MAG: D-alanyl-D-alanine carboxypeptidase [Alphaproteobacteria bacterium]|jgi:serine-type D-Ala-D-Ala carboxypeptidase (penicillin-binding protein 5/6)|nr:D-alanyl-D-alanine carboxypeptidase [Porticoccaceae bacterium]MDP4784637.1 D-alanyl-D-alanine carboxypeptidase [Alphaproteobacteria bacterium]